MEFEVFLKKAYDSFWWGTNVKVCFQAHAYPYSFFYQLLKQLNQKQILSTPLKRIYCDPFDQKKLFSMLGQSILGSHYYYWLGDITTSVKDKDKPKVIEFLTSYQGPHQIIFFIDDETIISHKKAFASLEIIKIKHIISFEEFQMLAAFFNYTLTEKKLMLVKKIFKQAETISLDFACILLSYLELINIRFIDEFLTYIIPQIQVQPSLTLLSESFFSKNAPLFFKTWSAIAHEYPDMFWITYWSEQIWKAYHVIVLMQQQDFSKAKKISFRLPYAFIQRDWKKFSLKQLRALHEQLYTIDFSFKQGSIFCSLDFFYLTHFLNQAS